MPECDWEVDYITQSELELYLLQKARHGASREVNEGVDQYLLYQITRARVALNH